MHFSVLIRRAALFVVMILSGGHLFIPRLPLVGVFLLLILALPQSPVRRLHKGIMPIFFLVGFLLVVEIVRPSSDLVQIATRGANFFCAIALLNVYLLTGMNIFRRDLFHITKLFSAQVIITVAVAAALPSLFVGVAGTSLQTLGFLFYFHSSSVVGGFELARPDGFFWEPGILQIYLNLCLFLSMWIFRSVAVSAATMLSIILTQSTTGFLVLGFQVLSYIFYIGFRGVSAKKHVSLVVMGVLAIPIYMLISQNVDDKIGGALRGSFYARNYDAEAGLRLAVENPWVGIGFNPELYLAKTQGYDVQVGEYDGTVFSDVRGNTNGIVTVLFSLGFPLGCLLVLGLLGQTAFASSWIIPGLLFLSLLSEPLMLTPFFLFFIFSSVIRFFGGRGVQLRPARAIE